MTKHALYFFWMLLMAAASLAASAQNASAANAVVGNGSPASCTEAAFDAALATASNGGGTITFDCGPAVTMISFTDSKFLTQDNVTIDGNNRIVLKAGNAKRLFMERATGGTVVSIQPGSALQADEGGVLVIR